MATATSILPIGWTNPTEDPPGDEFMSLFQSSSRHVAPVCVVLVDKQHERPTFMVLGFSLGASIMPTSAALYRMMLFTYPAGRPDLVGRLRADGYVDLISAGGC